MGKLGANEGVTGRIYMSYLQRTTTFLFSQEKVIPSVIIEPASNNEEEGEHEIITGAESKELAEDLALPGSTREMPELATGQKAAEDSQTAPSDQSASQASQEMPPGFLYKVLPFFQSGGQLSFLCFEALLLTPLVF